MFFSSILTDILRNINFCRFTEQTTMKLFLKKIVFNRKHQNNKYLVGQIHHRKVAKIKQIEIEQI